MNIRFYLKKQGGGNKRIKGGNYMGINPPIKHNEERRSASCAPAKKYNDTCYTKDTLTEMALAYNKYITKMDGGEELIEVNEETTNKEIIKQLTNRLKKECGKDQQCWKKQDFIKLIPNKEIRTEIEKYTFRPKGPEGRFTWLSTTDIDDVNRQYEKKYENYKFLGAVPMDFDDIPQYGIKNLNFDELYKNNKYKIGMIINLDKHNQNGSHWVALYANIQTGEIYYFDSYGSEPYLPITYFVDRIAKWYMKKNYGMDIKADGAYMRKNKKNNVEQMAGLTIKYGTMRHQYKSSECGVYSINFILELLNGKTFDDINETKLLDDIVNQRREIYFTY